MYRRVSAILLMLLVAPVAAADDVESFLQRLNLTRLQATYLEEQLQGLTDEERQPVIIRLASLYAQLLEHEDDPIRRKELTNSGRRLLTVAPADAGDELRLALARGAFRLVETTAENQRLRRSSPEDVREAIESLDELVPDFRAIVDRVTGRVELTERRLLRAARGEATSLTADLDRLRGTLYQARFLFGWSLYYRAWLEGAPKDARAAETLFASLLELDDVQSHPGDDVSVDMRRNEAYARSILGMALCRSMTHSHNSGLAWLNLLAHDATYRPIFEQTPAWEMAIHLEHEQYSRAYQILERYKDRDEPIPVAWLRLAAGYALEGADTNRTAMDLAQSAVTTLAAQGELAQVLDLADRYGTDALGNTGFASQYVRGAQAYQQARKGHGAEEPSNDPAVRDRYRAAEKFFQTALGESDAGRFPRARANAQWLVAFCAYFQNQLTVAKSAFIRASEVFSGDQAAESLWMAIVCLDLLQKDRDSALAAAELKSLIDRFLNEYPSATQAPLLRIKLAAGDRPTEASVDQLLEIPPSSDVYETSRRRAAMMLLQLFREAKSVDRRRLGNRFLDVAMPVLAMDEQRVHPDDAEAVNTYVTYARAVLEVALSDDVQRVTAASPTIAFLNRLMVDPRYDLSEHEDEIDYRRTKDRLFASDLIKADEYARRILDRDRSSLWARRVSMVVFRAAHARSSQSATNSQAALHLLVRYGRVIIASLGDDALKDRTSLGYYSQTARAMMELWRATGDQKLGAEAIELYDKLLEARPRDISFLRATALLSEKLGRPEHALECWRLLVTGLSVDSSEWFEAKYHLILVLVDTDPAHARKVMDQHRHLNPTYGPPPWDLQFAALDVRIPAAESVDQDGGAEQREPQP